jgi:hypothetical protein
MNLHICTHDFVSSKTLSENELLEYKDKENSKARALDFVLLCGLVGRDTLLL